MNVGAFFAGPFNLGGLDGEGPRLPSFLAVIIGTRRQDAVTRTAGVA
jgi:hypothetical protein